MTETTSDAEKEFLPKGSIAFFLGLIVFYSLIWLGLYLLMVGRH